MLIVYLIPLSIVIRDAKNSASISHILSDPKNKITVLISFFVFGVVCVCYENDRNIMPCTLLIISCLIGTYGSILFRPEYYSHDLFGFIALISFYAYMLLTSIIYQNSYLYVLFFLQTCVAAYLWTILNNKTNTIFAGEAGLIIIFAIYYFYIHYLEVSM
jgi:hypothetical protein